MKIVDKNSAIIILGEFQFSKKKKIFYKIFGYSASTF
uniref:Uncharacterized protein n=1 Tax=Megaselia scalaris TaxID=36166 RepID=T1GC20_MEGSC